MQIVLWYVLLCLSSHLTHFVTVQELVDGAGDDEWRIMIVNQSHISRVLLSVVCSDPLVVIRQILIVFLACYVHRILLSLLTPSTSNSHLTYEPEHHRGQVKLVPLNYADRSAQRFLPTGVGIRGCNSELLSELAFNPPPHCQDPSIRIFHPEHFFDLHPSFGIRIASTQQSSREWSRSDNFRNSNLARFVGRVRLRPLEHLVLAAAIVGGQCWCRQPASNTSYCRRNLGMRPRLASDVSELRYLVFTRKCSSLTHSVICSIPGSDF